MNHVPVGHSIQIQSIKSDFANPSCGLSNRKSALVNRMITEVYFLVEQFTTKLSRARFIFSTNNVSIYYIIWTMI